MMTTTRTMMMIVADIHTSCLLIPNLSPAFQTLLHPSHLHWLPNMPWLQTSFVRWVSTSDKPQLFPEDLSWPPPRTSICRGGKSTESFWSFFFQRGFSLSFRHGRQREEDTLAKRYLGSIDMTAWPTAPFPLPCLGEREWGIQPWN